MKIKKFICKYKWDILCNLILVIIYLLIISIKSRLGNYILGSTTDFETQHYLIPEYFRNLFYETGDLFPNFAFNLGGGQNIYYLSYYGLFSPIILISYLLPMIEMLDYLIFTMGLVVLSSVSLFYFYLRKNNYSHLISFLCSFIFLCSTPLIFHSNRHIMFINYLPFLILGFYGIDQFITKKKSFLLIISVLLMILTSYYFSISGIVVLFILALFKYIKNNKYKLKDIFSFSIKLIIRFFISIMISAILILPTFYTLLNGRENSSSNYLLSELFNIDLFMLHDNYSMGLTYICLIGTIFLLFKRDKAHRLLSLIILLISTIPVFSYILNGFLYISNKVLIPFIPLVLFNLAEFLSITFKSKWLKNSLIIYIIFSSLFLCVKFNMEETLIKKENNNLYEETSSYIKNIDDDFYRINFSFMKDKYTNKISSLDEYKTTIYSSSINKNYKDLYNYLFNNSYPYRSDHIMNSSNNILFQMYMNEKYLVTDYEYDYIYEKIYNDELKIYKNNYTLPLGYATNNIINEKNFEKLEYPENIINMLGRVVTKDKTNTKLIKSTTKIDYELISSENLNYEKKDNGYIITSTEEGKLQLKLQEDTKNKIIIINFDILKNASCSNGDLGIKINDVENILTCKGSKYPNHNYNFNYVIIGNKNNILDIKFNKGEYNIDNIKVSSIDFNLLKNINNSIDPFIIDKTKNSGDQINGNILVTENGYFTLSIPYDRGFNIYIDGEKIDYFKINKYFIGFKINKGNHNIKIIYKAPLKTISIVITVIGIITFLILLILEKNKRHKMSL